MNSTQLLQHFDRLSEAPDAIPRLRRFILDLAVRGKLVEQNPNDEPAVELLKRIQAEKERLGLTPRRKGAKKSEKAEQETLGDLAAWREMPFSVPQTWAWVEATYPAYLISDLGKKIQTKDVLDSGMFPVVDQGKLFIRGYCNDETKVIHINTPIILFGDHTRETKLIDFDFVVGADGVKLLQPVCLLPDYYYLALQWLPLDSRGYGRHFKLLRAAFLPLPPLAEQHRIVAKVDELMALCDQLQAAQTEREQSRDRLVAASLHRISDLTQSRHSGRDCRNPEHKDVNLSNDPPLRSGRGHQSTVIMEAKPEYLPVNWMPATSMDGGSAEEDMESSPPIHLCPRRYADMTGFDETGFILQNLPRLTTRPAHIKQLRQTILNLAVRGKLVPQDPNDEPATELLKRIQVEKERLGLTSRHKGAKKSEKADQETLDDLAAWRERFFYAPQGWQWIRFVDYALDISTGPFGSALHQSDYVLDGVPLVNPSHMANDRILPDKKVTVSEGMANQLATYRMRAGDIVMARRGEVGRAAIVSKVEDGWLCGTGSFFVRFQDEIFRKYILFLLRSDSVRKYLAGEAVGTTMVNLNHGILKKMPLAIPPIAEQHRIVAKVDELMTLCDQLETQLTTTEADSRRLLEAVLHESLAPTP